ncbi:hypothetical protein K492DRAFT_199794 [Lichtheimia hyalospora FSU 10163]|nr:hypothetical protein K492DRAFT_199794 [Lichtheimia hyalospora FSU 10163]
MVSAVIESSSSQTPELLMRNSYPVIDSIRTHPTPCETACQVDQGGSRLDFVSMQLNQAQPILIDAMGQLTWLGSLELITHRSSPDPFAQKFESLRRECQQLSCVPIIRDGIIPNYVLYQIKCFP